MLSSAHRLRRSADFQQVVRRGRRASSATVVVHGRRSLIPTAPAQVGFVVSKAVGNAVTRNTVKRRLREAMRRRMEALQGQVIVVRANPASSRADYWQLSDDLDRCLSSMAARADQERARR